MLQEQYEKYAIYKYENGLESDRPTAEEFATHLKFLKCLQGLYDIITSVVDNENAERKLWDCYTRIAERRFLIFAARLKEETMKLTDEEFTKYMKTILPPLDILLVWHAVLSHPKLSFDNFHRYDFSRFVNYPFPLTLIEEAISDTTFFFNPHKKYVAAFNALVNIHYDAYTPFNPCMKLPLFCPLCSNFIADISLLDETFTMCQLDENFTFPTTCECLGYEVTPDILRKRRFIKDCNNKRFLPNIVKQFLSAKRASSLIKEIQNHDIKVKSYKDLEEFQILPFHEFVEFVKNVKKDDMGYQMLLPYSNMTLLPFTIGSKILDYTRSIQKGVLVATKLLNKIAHVNWYGLLCDAEVAIERYEKFVALFKRADQPLMPTLDIELVWITHQLSQGHFFQFWKSRVGVAASFQNSSTFGASFNYTNDLYVQYYNEEYTVCYCWSCVGLRGKSRPFKMLVTQV